MNFRLLIYAALSASTALATTLQASASQADSFDQAQVSAQPDSTPVPEAFLYANHLYALADNGKVYVYTVTTSSITESPGSPYSIPEASSIIVLSK